MLYITHLDIYLNRRRPTDFADEPKINAEDAMFKIPSSLTAEPQGRFAKSKPWKFGLLLFCIALLFFNLFIIVFSPEETDNANSGLIVSIMLLLNHLAFSFSFTPNTRAVLRIAALVFVIAGLIYIAGVIFL